MIYLDYQATTPLATEALEAMMPYLTGKFGNPHSATHRFGWQARAIVDVARRQIGEALNVAGDAVVFTSGATEANNLALIGAMEAAPEGRNRLVTVCTEHACVLEGAHYLARRGFDVTVLPVGPDGLLDLDVVAAALDERVALVSVMAVNNEIGVTQPLAEIAGLAHGVGALMHSDAAQAFGKIALDPEAIGLDLVSLSAHKIYGPKGVGALYVRKGAKLNPHMHGGLQEPMRSGTLSPALCAGFGAAARLAADRQVGDLAHVTALSQQMLSTLADAGVDFRLNGDDRQRYPGNLNVSFPGCDGSRLLADLRGLAVSSGAACASAAGKSSYVLEALGVPDALAKATLRIGFGRPTTAAEIADAAGQIGAAVAHQTGQRVGAAGPA